MRKMLLCSLMLALLQQMAAQNKDTVKDKVIKVVIDYKTKSFKNSEILRNLKAKQWVQFSIINLPTQLKAAAVVNYGNRNLDLKNSFQGYLNFSKDNEYVKAAGSGKTNAEEANASIEANDKKAKIDATAAVSTAGKRDDAQKKLLDSLSKEKLYKLDVGTMVTDLEINITRNYLLAQYKITPTKALKEAIHDLNTQQRFVKYLQNNLKEKLEFRKNLALGYASKLDSVGPVDFKTHYFPPVKIENFDFSEFVVSITDEKNNVENFNVPFSIKHGFKLDFSTGFVFNGLYESKYKVVTFDTVHTAIKREDGRSNNSFNTGIALLAHAYRRSGNYLNFGATTGFSFNLNNQNLNYMLGGSMLMGEDQRFILSAGVSAGKVRELVNYYEVDTPISNTELPVTAQVPTVDRLKATWFLSISYNLGIGSASKSVKL